MTWKVMGIHVIMWNNIEGYGKTYMDTEGHGGYTWIWNDIEGHGWYRMTWNGMQCHWKECMDIQGYRRTYQGYGRAYKDIEGHIRPWKDIEGHGRTWYVRKDWNKMGTGSLYKGFSLVKSTHEYS